LAGRLGVLNEHCSFSCVIRCSGCDTRTLHSAVSHSRIICQAYTCSNTWSRSVAAASKHVRRIFSFVGLHQSVDVYIHRPSVALGEITVCSVVLGACDIKSRGGRTKAHLLLVRYMHAVAT